MKRSLPRRLLALLFGALLAISGSTHAIASATASSARVTFTADVWADNWFAMYVNGIRVATDPVPITTQKSFNKVSFTFSAKYPLTIAIVAKDYVDNSSGLEYIGTAQQQIGDAGLIAQIHEKVSGKLVASTSKSWKSYVTFKAPLNPECVSSKTPTTTCLSKVVNSPSSWYSSSYSDTKWLAATEYTREQVGVKEGFLEVNWDSRANLIWSSSLTLDNTVLFRTTAKAALSSTAMELRAPSVSQAGYLDTENTCDGLGVAPTLAWIGLPAAAKSLVLLMDTAAGPARPGEPVQTDFNHLVQYNIPVSSSGLDSRLAYGTKGKNFKGTLGYAAPCSQGPGEKIYTFHLVAVSASNLPTGLTGAQLLSAIAQATISTVTLDLKYSRKS